jgi:hypothetical protein
VILFRFLFQAWCRIIHGHIMLKFGEDMLCDGGTRSWYMCARCHRSEFIHDIPEIAS